MSSLNMKLSALTDELGIPQDVNDVITAELAAVERSGVAVGLAVGDEAPEFTLPDAAGRNVRLSDVLRDGPVVLSFYRGDWCPYCNVAVHTWQDRLADLSAAGGRFVAISPQRPTNALNLTEKHDLAFPVLSDETQDVIRAYKLQFNLPAALKDLYGNAWGLDLTQQNADGSWSLPVPGTYVIDGKRKIRYVFASADYRVRAEPDDVLAAVRSL